MIGQVDAGIGIKSAINFNGRKNYIGSFHPPMAAVITPLYLQTLPREHIRSGFAEILKIAIIRDERLFALMEARHGDLALNRFDLPEDTSREVLWCSIAAMLSELEPNIYEKANSQRKVDFGHTVSPILESASGFSLLHGEAVAIDIAFSAVLASHIGLFEWEACKRILSLILSIGLPIWSPILSLELCRAGFRDATLHRRGALNLIVPTAIGSTGHIAQAEDLSDHLLNSSLSSLKRMALSTSAEFRDATKRASLGHSHEYDNR